MSVKVKYKDNEIANLTETETKTLKTEGKYCEADILIENTESGGYPEPTGTIDIYNNGSVNVKDYETANVEVIPNLQDKIVNQNGLVEADEGFDGLNSVVVNVQGGGFDFLSVVTTLQMMGANLPETLNIDLPNATSLNNGFARTSGLKTITINAPLLTQMGGCFSGSSVSTVKFLSPAQLCTNFGQAFASSTITNVYGLDFRSQTSNLANNVFGSGLTNVEIVANTIKVNISFVNATKLTIESLVNIANALVEGSRTLTLSSTSKNLCDSIFVEYSSATDDTGTYNKATITESGGITLTNFITQVKGWTIA